MFPGDFTPQEAGRLLYLGQNEWAHVNCCLWSAEVFEEENGSLLHVHSAVARGRLMVNLISPKQCFLISVIDIWVVFLEKKNLRLILSHTYIHHQHELMPPFSFVHF